MGLALKVELCALKWLVTAHEWAQYSDLCWNHANIVSGESEIKDLQGSRKQRDEEYVEKIMATITTWHDPFAEHDSDKLLIQSCRKHFQRGKAFSEKKESMRKF